MRNKKFVFTCISALTLGAVACNSSEPGEKAKEVIANYTPVFKSKQEYFAYQDSICVCGDRIKYNVDKIEVEV